MNWGDISGVGALLVSVATAVGVLYKGWRTRVAAAATRPFQVGHEAITEAQTALRMKDERLAVAEADRLKAVGEAERAKAMLAAQQEQIDALYRRIGALTARNAAVEEKAKADAAEAAERDAQAQARITALESSLEEMRKTMGLGMSHE
jgi:chromosome segregation ATPase